jgi:hypothetical protein
MIYLQDNINATISKIRWGLSATVTTRTDGAVLGDDEHFREEVARPDADVILDAAHMAQPGALFKIDRNFELNQQQYNMLNDAREAIQKIGGISEEFQGSSTNQNQSGVAINAKIEQSSQSLANIDDNFKESRVQVGELLLAMLIQDSVGKPQEVKIPGNVLKEDKVVQLNQPVTDDDGLEYMNNDVERTMLKVDLDEVPSTSSFRTQQLSALSEAFKAAPPEYQKIILPHMMSLSDIPDKDEIIKAIKAADSQPGPEQQAMEIKLKEIEIKMRLADAQIKQLEAQGVKTLVESQYSAMQGGSQVTMQPAITPVADEILVNAGYQQPQPAGVDPGFSNQPYQQPAPVPVDANAQAQAQAGQQTLPTNLHPNMPVPPASPNMGAMGGIETQRTTDNLQ